MYCVDALGYFIGWPPVAVPRIAAASALKHLLSDGDLDGRYS